MKTDKNISNNQNKKLFKEKLIIAFFLGAVIASCVSIYGLSAVADSVKDLISLFVILVLFLGLIFYLFTYKYDWITKKIFGFNTKDIDETKLNARSLVTGIQENDQEKVKDNSIALLEKMSSWLSWLMYKRWVVSVFYTLFLGFASLLGSVLIYNQNELINNQNNKIEYQNHLAEATRRSALIYELTSILDKIDLEIRENRKDSILAQQIEGDDNISSVDYLNTLLEASSSKKYWELSSGLEGRIIALSRSLKPYYYYDYSKEYSKRNSDFIFGIGSGYDFEKTPLSPERGQLLISLLASKIELNQIMSVGDFMFADLKGADLGSYDLKYINLTGADLRDVSFIGTNLSFANLKNCNLKGANFENAILEHTQVNKDFFERFPNLRIRWQIVKDTLNGEIVWKSISKD